MALRAQKLFIKLKNPAQTGNFCELLEKIWRCAQVKPLPVGTRTSARYHLSWIEVHSIYICIATARALRTFLITELLFLLPSFFLLPPSFLLLPSSKSAREGALVGLTQPKASIKKDSLGKL
jgi:hypothetical protein